MYAIVTAEADQRRKGDALAKDLVVGELSSMRKELQQRLELEITTVKQVSTEVLRLAFIYVGLTKDIKPQEFELRMFKIVLVSRGILLK